MSVAQLDAIGAVRTLTRLYSFIPTALSYIASFSILFMMLMVCADIFMRFLFNAPIGGVAEVIANLIVTAVFLQFGSTIRDGRLIRADFIMGFWETNRPALARVAELFFFSVGALVLLVMLAWLWRDFLYAYQSSEFTGAPGAYVIQLWPFKLGTVIGCAIAIFECLILVLRAVSELRWRPARADAAIPSARRDFLPIVLFFAAVVLFFYLNSSAGLTSVQIGIMALIGLVVGVALGMPVAFALLALSTIGIWFVRDNFAIAENALGLSASGAIRSYEFGVVPLFVIMGLMLDKADVGRDAFLVSCALLRRIKGGLGIATVVANAIFASITGSSMASAAVFSRIAVFPMVETGYTKRFAVGIVAGSSVLGMLIPPSILMIIYGLLAEVSIGKLFIAGVLPGILLSISYSGLNVFLAMLFPKFTGVPKPFDLEEMSWSAILVRLFPVIAIVAVVMGGIYLGVFTPTEAGAVGALAAFVVAAARRKLSFRVVRDVVLETGYISAAILFLFIAASNYGRMLTISTLPLQLTSIITGAEIGMVTFLVIHVLIVVFLGMVLDSVSIMLITLPIVLPVAAALHADPIWFGIITIVAIEIGLLTPPFGLSVFVVKGTLPPNYVTLGDVFIGSAPFVAVMIIVTIILMIFPWISLALIR
jgi:tripartite ATP-independent transporter DctM subunit